MVVVVYGGEESNQFLRIMKYDFPASPTNDITILVVTVAGIFMIFTSPDVFWLCLFMEGRSF